LSAARSLHSDIEPFTPRASNAVDDVIAGQLVVIETAVRGASGFRPLCQPRGNILHAETFMPAKYFSMPRDGRPAFMLESYRWLSYCRGMFQLPAAA